MKPKFYPKNTIVLLAIFLINIQSSWSIGTFILDSTGNVNTATCNSQLNISVTARNYSGSVNFIWKLSNGVILPSTIYKGYNYIKSYLSPNPNIDSTTTYYITATDSLGHQAKTSINISVPIAISGYLNNYYSSSVCPGETFSTYFTGDNSINSYVWKFDDTTQISGTTNINKSFTYARKHYYSIEVKNACGVDSIIKDSIIVDNKIRFSNSFSVDISQTDLCPGQNATFNVNYYGNNAIKSYLWNFGDSITSSLESTNHSYKYSKTDSVKLKLSNYCNIDTIVSTTINISHTNHIPVGLTISGIYTICPGDNLNLGINGIPIPNPIYSYKWNFGDGNLSTIENPNHVYTKAGNYTISLALSDYCGFTDTIKSIVRVKNNLTFPQGIITINTPYQPIVNQLINFSYYNNLNPDTMSVASQKWYFGDGDSSLSISPYHIYNTCKPETITLVTKNYCEYTSTSNIYNLFISDISSTPYVNLYSASSGSPDNMLVFDAATNGSISANNYTWNFGDGKKLTTSSTEVFHYYADSGKYTVNLSAKGACGDSVSTSNLINITGNYYFADPNIELLSNNTPNCINTPFNFSIYSSVFLKKYIWNLGDGTSYNGLSVVHNYSKAGNYTVSLQVTDFNNRDTILFYNAIVKNNYKLFTGAAISTDQSQYCPGSNVLFYLGSNNIVKSEIGNYNRLWEAVKYDWTFGDGSKATTFKNNVEHQYNGLKNYSVSLTLTNGCGYDTIIYDTLQFANNIYANNYLYASSSDNIFCPGQMENFNVSGGSGTIQWNFGDTIISGNSVYYAFSKPGEYNIPVTITNSCGHDTILYVPILVSNKASLANSSSFSIETNNFTCNNDSVYITVNQPGKSYIWNFGDGTPNDSTIKNIDGLIVGKHKYASDSGIYNITLNEIDFCGVSHSLNNEIVLIPNASIISNTNNYNEILTDINDSVCVNRKAYFIYSSFEPVNICNFGDGTALVTNKSAYGTLIHLFKTAGNFIINLTSKSSCGDSITNNLSINVRNCQLPLSANFNYTKSKNIVQFMSPTANKATSWFWNFGDNSNSSLQSVSHNYTKSGIYNVCLYTGDKQGDTASHCQNISIDTVNCNAISNFYTYTANIVTLQQIFTDKSTGNISHWNWNFGDGSTSSMQNPVHNYTKTGNYTVTLSVSDNLNSCINVSQQSVQVGNQACTAGFTYTSSSQTITFTNTSTGSLSIYYWDFGDGSFSTKINTSHTYLKPGNYLVSLTVSTSNLSCMDNIIIPIMVGTVGCDAQFTQYVDSTSKTVYLKENNSSNNTYEYWSFGDGNISVNQSPSHSFNASGFYTISLSAFNLSGCMDYSEKVVTIGSEGNDCQSDFMYQVDSVNNTVNFYDNSIGNIKTYYWNFGDNSNLQPSTVQNPTFKYSKAGYYNVCHLVVNQKGISNIDCKNIQVGTGCSAIFNFIVNPVSNTAYFTDASMGNPDNWSWNFNDNNVAINQNPTHLYKTNGYFEVSLKISNSKTGCSDKTYKTIPVGVIPTGLIAGFGYDALQPNAKADGYPVDFTGAGVGDHARLRWAFGDSTIDTTSTTPRHYYNIAGSYYVCYYISDPITGAIDSACQQIETSPTIINELNTNNNNLVVYPNPLKTLTTIQFNLQRGSNVELSLVDMTGRTIETVLKSYRNAGNNYFYWNTSNLDKGVYFMQLKTTNGNKLSKILIKQ
jgi:PKD repeat protein